MATTTARASADSLITSSTFRAIGTTHRILVTDPAALAQATLIAKDHLADLDLAASRFRPDSEVSRLAARAEHGPATTWASPVFVAYLRAALHAARITDGLVDPTVGRGVVASGYDGDIDSVRARTTYAAGTAGAAVPGWQSVTIDEATDAVRVPQGCLIDLGATAKAYAADNIAARLAERLPGGFLVNLGGDIAVSGVAPQGGWRIGVEAADGSILQVIVSTGQAVTTSSTRLRTWTLQGESTGHHILDPRTGRTAATIWAQVTCVAANALEANAASTAAIILGLDAPDWLQRNGIPARLDGIDGTMVTTPGWPDPREITGRAS